MAKKMYKRRQVIGYLFGAVLALLFYLGWFLIIVEPSIPSAEATSIQFRLGTALFFSIFGFGPALILISLLWTVVVKIFRRLHWSGPIYFVVVGAFLTLAIGSGVSSLSPKPLFVEDQTFIEGIVIAIERQGISLFFAGIILGFTYWFLGERGALLMEQAEK
jgi:hypothetical protein